MVDSLERFSTPQNKDNLNIKKFIRVYYMAESENKRSSNEAKRFNNSSLSFLLYVNIRNIFYFQALIKKIILRNIFR